MAGLLCGRFWILGGFLAPGRKIRRGGDGRLAAMSAPVFGIIHGVPPVPFQAAGFGAGYFTFRAAVAGAGRGGLKDAAAYRANNLTHGRRLYSGRLRRIE